MFCFKIKLNSCLINYYSGQIVPKKLFPNNKTMLQTAFHSLNQLKNDNISFKLCRFSSFFFKKTNSLI